MNDANLIRNDSPHQVTLAEGTNVAIGKKADAVEPSVRKVLAEPDGIVIEHSLQDDLALLPEADLVKAELEQPTFERQLKEDHALAPAAVDAAEAMALAPASLPEAPARVFVPEAAVVASPAQGPVIERSESDRFVQVPTVAPEAVLQPKEPVPAWALEKPEAVLMGSADAEPLALSDTMETMLQMDFPARVVKLKIENDKVRTKLDGLQTSMRN
jgi:hypothetical protein